MSDRSHCPHEVGAGRLAADRDRVFRQRAHEHESRPDRVAEVAEAVRILEADYAHGSYSGGGYRYVEATPEALRTVLDAINALHPKESPK